MSETENINSDTGEVICDKCNGKGFETLYTFNRTCQSCFGIKKYWIDNLTVPFARTFGYIRSLGVVQRSIQKFTIASYHNSNPNIPNIFINNKNQFLELLERIFNYQPSHNQEFIFYNPDINTTDTITIYGGDHKYIIQEVKLTDEEKQIRYMNGVN